MNNRICPECNLRERCSESHICYECSIVDDPIQETEELTTAEIQERHDVYQTVVNKGCDDLMVLPMHNDRGILLKRLEAAEKRNRGLSITLTVANEQLEAAEKRSDLWKENSIEIKAEYLEAEAAIKDISELPDKWRNEVSDHPVAIYAGSIMKLCADELQASINRSKS